MPDIRRTAQAEEDLIDLWLYIAQDNPGAADRLLDEIEDKCSLLAANPQLGPARPDIAADCRSFPVGRYLILYRSFRTASRWAGWCKDPAAGKPLSWGLKY